MKMKNLHSGAIVVGKLTGTIYRVTSVGPHWAELIVVRPANGTAQHVGDVACVDAGNLRTPRVSDVRKGDVFSHRRRGDNKMVTYDAIGNNPVCVYANGRGNTYMPSHFSELGQKIVFDVILPRPYDDDKTTLALLGFSPITTTGYIAVLDEVEYGDEDDVYPWRIDLYSPAGKFVDTEWYTADGTYLDDGEPSVRFGNLVRIGE